MNKQETWEALWMQLLGRIPEGPRIKSKVTEQTTYRLMVKAKT